METYWDNNLVLAHNDYHVENLIHKMYLNKVKSFREDFKKDYLGNDSFLTNLIIISCEILEIDDKTLSIEVKSLNGSFFYVEFEKLIYCKEQREEI